MGVLALNKRAKFDYEFLETYEAGIVLRGHEVKSVKQGHVSLKGAFVRLSSDRSNLPFLELVNTHISRYKQAGPMPDHDPERPRKLLLHKKEIERLIGKKNEQGLTMIPVKIYTKRSLIKVEIALARGKKKHDKREDIKKRDVDRQIDRAMKTRR